MIVIVALVQRQQNGNAISKTTGPVPARRLHNGAPLHIALGKGCRRFDRSLESL